MIGKNEYQTPVRIANWYEDICLEETDIKDFLDKKNKGQLLMQKRAIVTENILKKVYLTVTNDGLVHFGDVIQLRCPGDDIPSIIGRSRQDSVLAANCSIDTITQNGRLAEPCKVTGCRDLVANVRTSFVVTSFDGTPNGHPLRYTQRFYLTTTNGSGGNLFLKSDTFGFTKCAFRTRHQEVSLVSKPSYLTEWRVMYYNPLFRMEHECMPVPANTQVLINHAYTNQNLCVEDGARMVRTPFSVEYEITAHTYLNSHHAEEFKNYWVLATRESGTPIIMPSAEPNAAEVGEPCLEAPPCCKDEQPVEEPIQELCNAEQPAEGCCTVQAPIEICQETTDPCQC